jgi:hypothetical protein
MPSHSRLAPKVPSRRKEEGTHEGEESERERGMTDGWDMLRENEGEEEKGWRHRMHGCIDGVMGCHRCLRNNPVGL